MGKIGNLELNRIYQMDCIEGMRLLPDESIDLIIADPPYYKIKGDFDFQWRTMDEYLSWCSKWIKECERVLSPRGSLYVYGVELQLEYIATIIDKTTKLEYKNRITLNKRSYIKDKYGHMEHFRKYIPVAEYLLFYTFRDETGLTKVKHDLNNFATLRNYFREFQEALGLTKKAIIDRIGQRADHCFRWGSSQWDLPTPETYEDLLKLPRRADFEPRSYESLRQEYESLRKEYESIRREYENNRYTFNAKDGMTNVWDFEPDRGKQKTKHPTQKPLAICERIISVSSNEGDIVLVPFAGSGSECVAALRNNRHFIGFEREPEYVEIANKRLENVWDELKSV